MDKKTLEQLQNLEEFENQCECGVARDTAKEKAILKIENLSQDYVADAVEDVIKLSQIDGTNGISNMILDRCEEKVTIEYNPNLVNLDYIKETINQLGYKVEVQKQK